MFFRSKIVLIGLFMSSVPVYAPQGIDMREIIPWDLGENHSVSVSPAQREAEQFLRKSEVFIDDVKTLESLFQNFKSLVESAQPEGETHDDRVSFVDALNQKSDPVFNVLTKLISDQTRAYIYATKLRKNQPLLSGHADQLIENIDRSLDVLTQFADDPSVTYDIHNPETFFIPVEFIQQKIKNVILKKMDTVLEDQMAKLDDRLKKLNEPTS